MHADLFVNLLVSIIHGLYIGGKYKHNSQFSLKFKHKAKDLIDSF